MSLSSTSSSHDVYLAPRTVARVVRDVQELLKHPETGVRLMVDEATGLPANLRELTAEMEGPQETPYEGKSFLLRFTFGAEFPATPPTAHFLTKVYHPNICMSTGAVCVNTLKRDWLSSHTLKHCLAVIRCLLVQPFPDSALNEDAGKLFMESYEEYCKRARLHADVHGRPLLVVPSHTAAAATISSMTTTGGGGAGAAADPRVLASRNQSSFSASAPNQHTGIVHHNNLPAADKKKLMTKKKSLKRL